jgi:hypothetical protein
MTVVSGCASAGDELTDGIGLLNQNLIDDDTQPAPEISAIPTDPQHGMWHLALPGGRVLRARRVPRILDVRDAQHPRIESEISDYYANPPFFRIGNHAIFEGGSEYRYRGEREDIPISREQTQGLLNVDFSDPAKLRLVNIVPARIRFSPELLVVGQGQAGSALYRVENKNTQDDLVWLSRYELQNEQLVLTGELQLTEDVEKIESVGSRVLLHLRKYGKPAPIAVIDGSGPDLLTVYETSVPGTDVQALAIDGPKLRVAYSRNLKDGSSIPGVDTFDLTKDDAFGRAGRCDLGLSPDPEYSTHFSATFYSNSEHTLFAGDRGQDRTYLIPFNAAGKCPLRRVLDTAHSKAFHMPAPQRLLAVNSRNLRIFDTARSATVPLLASAPIEHFYYYTETVKPIQVFGLTHAATALDGTPEPWLVGLPYYDEYGVTLGAFQLFSASARTLTARSTIYEYARTGDLALFDSTLVTMSSEGLRTFDISDLNQPKPLGSLDLDVGVEYRFGDYSVRTRSAPASGPPEDIDSVQEVLLERIDAVGQTPIASWPVRRNSTWLKADDLLLEARWIFTASALSPYLTLQVYDLSDPTRPRKAGVFFTDEIRRGSASYSEFGLTMRAIGRSLAIAQRRLVDGSPTGPWSDLRVVNLQDPDDPKLFQRFSPSERADFSTLGSGVALGTSLYLSHQNDDGLYGTGISVNPMGWPHEYSFRIPDPIAAASPDAIYTATPSDTASDLTVSRIVWRGEVSPPTAARTWPGRQLSSMHADAGPYIYLTHGPRLDVPQGTEPHSHWARLEILDATTLATVGALDIDTQAEIKLSANGRLFIAIPGALLFVDVRDPTHPKAQAAVPATSYHAQILPYGDRVYVVTSKAQNYPIDLQNLLP